MTETRIELIRDADGWHICRHFRVDGDRAEHCDEPYRIDATTEAEARAIAERNYPGIPVKVTFDEIGEDWIPIEDRLPDEGKAVDTLIHDNRGTRNNQPLILRGRLWFLEDGSMYVYYQPTHWKPKQ